MKQYPNVTPIPDSDNSNATSLSKFNVRSSSPSHRDLREFQDDRTILRNPHKGWYWHYIDNGYKRGAYRENHDPADHLERFPGLNHLYLRFDWGDIEKEKGVYDWSYVDGIMEEWAKYDYRFSMRFVTYEADGNIPFATPEYVFEEGARGFALSGGRIEPDYGDPVFLENLERFLEEAGKRYNGNPLIELIDLGTFGTWGEGHTAFGSDSIHPAEVIKKHIDLSKKYFPDTFIILNDDHINHRWNRGARENHELIGYAAARGLGLEDDSVCVGCYADRCGYNTLRSPWLFDIFRENAPTVLEFEHYHMVPPEIFKNGYPFIDAMQRTQCTYAGFHGYPVPWLEREPYLTEYAANRLGYWYFLDSATLPPDVKSGQKTPATLFVENRGFARAYHPFTLKLKVETESACQTQVIPCDNKLWMPGRITPVDISFTPGEGLKGPAEVSVGLFEKDRPIQLAMKNGSDGFYPIGKINIE